MYKQVDKPWGHELIWAHTEHYVGKILYIRENEALSLQYHEYKDETIMVIKGCIELTFFGAAEKPQVRLLMPKQVMHIPPGLRHRMKALEYTEVLEVSTPQLDDVVRLEDKYGRVK